MIFMKLSMMIIFIAGFNQCLGYRILGIFPLNAKSHFMMFEQLMKGLARSNHQVDVISTYPLKKSVPNYTDIVVPSSIHNIINNISYDMFGSVLSSNYKQLNFFARGLGNKVCSTVLNDPQVKELIKKPLKNSPYDLVIMEMFSAHCFLAFGYHWKIPVIGVSSAALYPWGNDLIANPENLAFSPNNLINKPFDEMDFWGRFHNTLYSLSSKLLFNYLRSPQEDIIKEAFGPNTPGMKDLEGTFALILTNTHPSLNGPKPITPALVEVAGLHVQDDGPEIPVADKKWMDESNEGFIYFTFGSLITIESFPRNMIRAIYKSCEKISPVRILMKIPRPELLPPGLPKNIRTFSWMPQIKVFKHKNIRAFVTHGGLMGTQEAITYAIPMIGIPLFADQFANVNLYVKKKIGISLDYNDLTEEKLDHAFNEILFNPVYRNAAKKFSKLFLDRPIKALDEAIYWVEYIVRHGSDALRSPAMDLNWWQIALLDVYATLFLFMISVVIVSTVVLKYLIIFCVKKTYVSESMRVKKVK